MKYLSSRKYIPFLRSLLFLACTCCLAGAVHAQSSSGGEPEKEHEQEQAIFSFKGYGTVGLAHSSEKDADFIAHDLQRRGAGRHGNWSAEVDSRLGAQVDAKFNSAFSAVVQVTTEQRYDGKYDPEIEWANLKYQVTPDVSVRAGRIVMPTFLFSDSRKVGYATPWVRPPVEVYSLVPLSRLDGVDGSWRQNIGELNNTLQLGYGKSSARMPDDEPGKVDAKNGWLVSDTMEYGHSTLRFSYIQARGTITSYKQLFDGYRDLAALLGPFIPAVASQAASVIDKYEPDDKRFSIFSIGASYNPGKWFVMGEYGVIDTNSIYGKRSGWYVTSGHRAGAFTPYISYAESHRNSNSSDPGVAHAFAADANRELNKQLSAAPVQKTISLGVRWDCATNIALKMQYDRTNIGSGSPGSLDHQSDDYVNGGKFNVFSVTADFLF